jgi:hypothetical protein
MNIDITALTSKFATIKDFIVRYALIIFIIGVVGILGFMTLTISHFSNLEPTDDQIDEKKSSLKAVRLDEKSIAKLVQLEDRGINIESLFNNGRTNPFE